MSIAAVERNSGVAVDEKVADVARVAAEGEDRLDVGPLGQDDALIRLDRVVKAQCGAKVRIEVLQCLGLGPVGVEIDRTWVTPRSAWPSSSSRPQTVSAEKVGGFMRGPLA